MYAAAFLGSWGKDWLVPTLTNILASVIIAVAIWAYWWWRNRRPVHLLLERLADKKEPIQVYTRDFESMVFDPVAKTPKRVKLLVYEPLVPTWGEIDNVPTLWSRVEALTYGGLLYVLSLASKTEPIEVIEMSKDRRQWDTGHVVLGAQTERCYQFYRDMKGVAYTMDGKGIYDRAGNLIDDPEIDEEHIGDYRYGIILKCRNPYRSPDKRGTAFLIGGLGVDGTEAAGYYFRHYYRELTRLFGNRTFGVVIRVHKDRAAETATRVQALDCATEKKRLWTRRLWEFLPFTQTQVDV